MREDTIAGEGHRDDAQSSNPDWEGQELIRPGSAPFAPSTTITQRAEASGTARPALTCRSAEQEEFQRSKERVRFFGARSPADQACVALER